MPHGRGGFIIAGMTSVGFRTKTGKAIAIALARRDAPEFSGRWNLELWDRELPATGEPHHEVMELPWPEALIAVRRYEDRIADVATERLRGLLDETKIQSIGVVGSPDRNLEKIGNRHIRAHAAEGMLFRRAIEIAAQRCGIRCRQFSDRGFEQTAMKELRCTSNMLANVMQTIGRAAGRPWRADERAAATAAWVAML